MEKTMRPIKPMKLSSSVTPSPDLGIIPVLKMIPIERLVVDGRYQREAARNKSMILKIVREFRWSKFQPITVAAVGDYFAIIDGQHRAIAAGSHPSIASVPCWIVPQQDVPEQARTFVDINKNRTAITSVQIYYAGLAANNPDALRIRDVCSEAGVSVARYSNEVRLKNDQTMAVNSIDRLLRKAGDRVVIEGIRIIREAYPHKPQQLTAINIETIVVFLEKYGANPNFDRGRFVERLRDVSLQVALGVARVQRNNIGGSVIHHIIAELYQTYNSGLRVNRLPRLKHLKDAA